MKAHEYLKSISIDERLMLTFLLQGEHFAAETKYVKEIIDYLKATRVPGTPDYFKGLINLRGNIVPVIDLSKKFALGELTGEDLSIIILELSDRQLGFLVDRVMRLIQLQEGQIEITSLDIPERLGFSNIKGIVNILQQSYFILDIEQLFQELFLE